MNLPNRLTLLRIVLIPLFLLFLMVESFAPWGRYIAVGVFVFAALTDTLDGYLARVHAQETVMGKFLDPLADKIMVSAALVALVELHMIASWVAILIIAREFAVTALRLVAVQKGEVIAADDLAKAKTIIQVIAISFIMADLNVEIMTKDLGWYLMALALVLTYVSGIRYFMRTYKYLVEV